MARVLNGQVADTLATKRDLADLKHDLSLRTGVMLVAAITAITVLDRLLN